MKSANFVEETTTSIAGTSGNGAVTLTQIAGIPRLSTALGSAKRMVRYVIEDTANKKFESGIGSVAANVLTRTKPQVTWDGTTWDDTAPTPLAFGSTPTAGAILVRLAALAESQSAIVGAMQNVIGDPDWKQHIIPPQCCTVNGGGSLPLSADRLYYTYTRIDAAGVIPSVQTLIDVAVTSANLLIGLYDVGPDGLPNSQLATFGAISAATTGVKSSAIATPAGGLYITPGWYAIAYITNAAISIHGWAGTVSQQVRGPLGYAGAYGEIYTLYVDQPYSSGLPAAFGGTPGIAALNNMGANVNNPMIGLKLA